VGHRYGIAPIRVGRPLLFVLWLRTLRSVSEIGMDSRYKMQVRFPPTARRPYRVSGSDGSLFTKGRSYSWVIYSLLTN
jgi:hypothetical protein